MKKLFLLFVAIALTSSSFAQTQILKSSTTTVRDADITSFLPSTNYGANEVRFAVFNWTQGGIHNDVRSLVDFDLSPLPENIIIDSAYLILHHASFPQYNIEVHAGSNSFYVERVIEDWVESDITWNNQPTSTIINRSIAPASVVDTQDYKIEVTALVKDMLGDPDHSFGFLLKHVIEQPFKANIFASSEHADSTLHQELVVSYKLVNSTIELGDKNNFLISPNPTSSVLNIRNLTDKPINQVTIRDITGKVIRTLSGNVTKIDFKNKGVYLLEIRSNNKYYYKRTVVQ